MKFPVLCIPIDACVFLAVTVEELETTRISESLTNRILTGMQVIDSSESCFVVRSCSEERPRAAVVRKLAQLFDLKRGLRLEIEPIPPLAVSDVKIAVIRSFAEDQEGFEESSGMDVDWWRRELSQASSSREVVSLFAKAAGAA
jgi:hypothetical protein